MLGKNREKNVLLLFGRNGGRAKKITNMCFHFSPLYLVYVYSEQTRRYTTKRIITVTVQRNNFFPGITRKTNTIY